MSQIKFKITNLTCPACVKISEMTLRDISGVTMAKVDLATGETSVESNRDISFEEISNVLKSADKIAALIN